jgi:Uma2 family endonuclease
MTQLDESAPDVKATAAEPGPETLADLLERLGSIPLERVRMHPAPGTAVEEDVLRHLVGGRTLCELVDGVLVEKPMGFYESILAAVLIEHLRVFVKARDLGVVVSPDGTMRLESGLVRSPDVGFLSWNRFPGRKLPRDPIPAIAPDLAVEVISRGNTEPEMERKLREYFRSGARLVWYTDPRTRTVRVYTSPESVTLLDESGTLDGGDVLPGFSLPIRQWFAEAGEQADDSPRAQ